MKNIEELITQFREEKIFLSLVNKSINIKYKGEGISNDKLDVIKNNKNEIIKYLQSIDDYETIENIYPLSPMQEGMLFHSVLSPNSEVYVTQMSVDFVGNLDFEALITAWQKLIETHTILRTSFVSEGVLNPLQRVHKSVVCKINRLDYNGLSEGEKNEKINALLKEDRKNGFDLTQAPLSNFTLIKMSENRHTFVWSHHHILLDGWSMTTIFKELFQHYYASCANESLPIKLDKYEDFIEHMLHKDKTKSEQFWKEYLEGFDRPTEIPFANS